MFLLWRWWESNPRLRDLIINKILHVYTLHSCSLAVIYLKLQNFWAVGIIYPTRFHHLHFSNAGNSFFATFSVSADSCHLHSLLYSSFISYSRSEKDYFSFSFYCFECLKDSSIHVLLLFKCCQNHPSPFILFYLFYCI